MDAPNRIERALADALGLAENANGPRGLGQAMRYAVFPAGARIRPHLCLAVAKACGDDQPHIADAAAASIELLHCASLVHDDLPCFDDAPIRRGRASVHRAFGERLAVLAGDALIVLAFQTLARTGQSAERLPALTLIIAQACGAPFGIVAGQAWECEGEVVLSAYQRAKTGALFAAATRAGAAAAGADSRPWHAVGENLGEAYQVVDDLADAFGEAQDLGKPVRVDATLGRPNAVAQLGVDGAMRRVSSLIGAALDAVPPCAGAAELRGKIAADARRLLPRCRARTAA